MDIAALGDKVYLAKGPRWLRDIFWRWGALLDEPQEPPEMKVRSEEEALWAFGQMFREKFPNATDFAITVITWVYTIPWCNTTAMYYDLRYVLTGKRPFQEWSHYDVGPNEGCVDYSFNPNTGWY